MKKRIKPLAKGDHLQLLTKRFQIRLLALMWDFSLVESHSLGRGH
jgi:hypothetical protein